MIQLIRLFVIKKILKKYRSILNKIACPGPARYIAFRKCLILLHRKLKLLIND